MSRALGHRVVAEGVEEEEQLDGIRDQGFDLAQGYLLSPPLRPGEFEALLATRHGLVAP